MIVHSLPQFIIVCMINNTSECLVYIIVIVCIHFIIDRDIFVNCTWGDTRWQ